MTNHEEFRDINKLLSTINNKTKNAKTKALTCAFVRQVIGINIYFKQIRVCVCMWARQRETDRQTVQLRGRKREGEGERVLATKPHKHIRQNSENKKWAQQKHIWEKCFTTLSL